MKIALLRITKVSFFCFALFVMLGVVSSKNCLGQGKLVEGESVKVKFLSSWRDGVVMGVKGKRIAVEFEFASSVKQEVVNRNAIRKLCEVDAVDFVRTWQNETGEFKITAALKALEGNEVVLIKDDEDLTELKVALDRLSKKDNAYVAKMKKMHDDMVKTGKIPADTPPLPEIKTFGGQFGSMSNFDGDSSSQVQKLGPIPSFLREFTQTGTGFNFSRKDQDLVSVIPVGGPEQLVLMTAREDNWVSSKPNWHAEVYWVSMAKQGFEQSGDRARGLCHRL